MISNTILSTLPNIIFTDIDGVLVTDRASIATRSDKGGFSYFDPIACLLIRRLCEDCNARLVISSAWREEHSRDAMQAILNAACPSLGNYIWSKTNMWCTSKYVLPADEYDLTSDRGREIKNWIDCHATQFNNFCIIDDMADMRPLQESLVKCDTVDGVGYYQYQTAKELLNAAA